MPFSSTLQEYLERFSFQSKPISTFLTEIKTSDSVGNIPWMPGVETFCLRVFEAVLKQEKICIYSDYDTDAVTATGVMYWGLLDLGVLPEKISFYAPDRFTEGYGMNPEAVADLCDKYDLIISVDCGINSVLEAEVAKNKQTDLIITDHHHLHGQIPEALAVINPRLSEYFFNSPQKLPQNQVAESPKFPKWVLGEDLSEYNFDKFEIDTQKILNWRQKWSDFAKNNFDKNSKNPYAYASSTVTGVGVSWLCVLHLAFFMQEIGVLKSSIKIINKTLPLVAIGTIADCQSVLDPLNRLFVRAGLLVMQKNQHNLPGLTELTKQTGLQAQMEGGYKLTSQDLAFTFSPILNSSGRLTHAKLSIETVIAQNQFIAKQKAEELIATNQERKAYVKSVIADVDLATTISLDQQILDNYKNSSNSQPIIWLEGDWNKGIIGLVASRLVSKHQVPCIIISNQDPNYASSSLRAPEGFHLPLAMKEAGEELFEKFGGHPGAAGFSAKYENLEKIKQGMQAAFAKQFEQQNMPETSFLPDFLKNKDLPEGIKNLQYDKKYIWTDFSQLSAQNLQSIWQLDPFGIDFPLPIFIFKLSSWNLKWLGNEQKHLKLMPPQINIVDNMGANTTITAFNIDNKIRDYFLEHQNQNSNQSSSQDFNQEIWICAKPSQNTWNNKTTHELIAEEIVVS